MVVVLFFGDSFLYYLYFRCYDKLFDMNKGESFRLFYGLKWYYLLW